MTSRRVEMVILSSPRILESILSIAVPTGKLTRQFFPMFKYHNPKLVLTSSDTLEVTFIDNSVASIDEPNFHTAAQRIIDLNREKSISILADRQKI